MNLWHNYAMISTVKINSLYKTKEKNQSGKSIKSSAELRELSAYTLIHEEYLDDIKSAGLIFRHKKAGRAYVFSQTATKTKSFAPASAQRLKIAQVCLT